MALWLLMVLSPKHKDSLFSNSAVGMLKHWGTQGGPPPEFLIVEQIVGLT